MGREKEGIIIFRLSMESVQEILGRVEARSREVLGEIRRIKGLIKDEAELFGIMRDFSVRMGEMHNLYEEMSKAYEREGATR